MRAKVDRAPGFDWRRPHHWLAYGFGSGLSPWAPGTAGTLVAVPLYLLLRPLPVGWYLALLLALCLIGVWACGKTARELGADDPSAIVWDEILGYLLAMAAAPPGWPWIIGGFVLFRIFDIRKPWPVGELDRRVKGGLGVVLDDLVAGLMALAVIQAVAYLLGP